MNKNGIEKELENQNVTIVGNGPRSSEGAAGIDQTEKVVSNPGTGFAVDQEEDSGALRKRRSTPTRSFKF